MLIRERILVFALALALLGVYLASSSPSLTSDIAGGGLIVLLPFYLFPEAVQPRRAGQNPRNRRRALLYGFCAAFWLVLAIAAWPNGAPALWPATAYLLVCYAYAGGGPAVFRKSSGKMDWAASLLLAPYLWAARSSLPYLRSKSPLYAAAAPRLYFGRLPHSSDKLPDDVTAVLDLTAEHPEEPALLDLEYRNVQILDHTLPTSQQLAEALAFIEQQIPHGSVYVHCAYGFSRSAGIVAAYLLKTSACATPELARQHLVGRRSQVALSRKWLEFLEAAVERPPATGPEPAKPAVPARAETRHTARSR